jgi:hypothetical protein
VKVIKFSRKNFTNPIFNTEKTPKWFMRGNMRFYVGLDDLFDSVFLRLDLNKIRED